MECPTWVVASDASLGGAFCALMIACDRSYHRRRRSTWS